jgi:hypothetical protein
LVYSAVVPTQIDQSVILEGVYFFGTDETTLGIVLTPACDFEQKKAELVQLCQLRDAFDFIAVLIQHEWKKLGLVDANGNRIAEPLSSGKKKDLSEKLRSIIRQRFPRYHWLPPFVGSKRPLIADFQSVTSLNPEDLEGAHIVAALESPYRESLPTRYAAYMGRVGTPDYPAAHEQEWIDRTIEVLFPPPPATR